MLAQINPVAGDLEYNLSKHKECLDIARKKQVDLVVFPEMSISGYPVDDLVSYEWWQDKVQETIHKLCSHTKDISCLVGAPSISGTKENHNRLNQVFFIQEQKIHQRYAKILLPTHGVFDESRYFVPGEEKLILELQGLRIGMTICEDVWHVPGKITSTFRINPLQTLKTEKLDLLINMSASPFEKQKIYFRQKLFRDVSEYLDCSVAFCNQWGGQDHLVFDGTSFVYSKKEKKYYQGLSFEKDQLIFECSKDNLRVLSHKETLAETLPNKDAMTVIKKALCCGLKDYCTKLGFEKVLVALSGGIDSSVVACLAVEALGKSQVTAVYLPSQYNPASSQDDVLKLTRLLDIHLIQAPIESVHSSFKHCIDSYLTKDNREITMENLQARIRGIFMMSLANNQRALLLATSNKSELALGFYTLYGDSCGALGIIGDLYKTEVYEMAHAINQGGQIIPESILSKEPSAELAPEQKDSDCLPSYPVLDPWLEKVIEKKAHPLEGSSPKLEHFDKTQLFRTLHKNEFKRRQSPFVLKISSQALHPPERRIPITSRFF
jgi:NAD+ synthase (glutamine-hydrolysing)